LIQDFILFFVFKIAEYIVVDNVFTIVKFYFYITGFLQAIIAMPQIYVAYVFVGVKWLSAFFLGTWKF